ncbi:MAG: ribbon-helix-helix protein, CopG family [Acidobacteria bacterium]|nr:ribbon-helix-helix protein, CopG family [Acidobacteriota bacterium]
MSKRLQVLIPEGLDARVSKAAQRTRVSKGEWVRRALERALEDRRDDPDPVARLARLGGPTGDIEQILAEIDAGRG